MFFVINNFLVIDKIKIYDSLKKKLHCSCYLVVEKKKMKKASDAEIQVTSVLLAACILQAESYYNDI